MDSYSGSEPRLFISFRLGNETNGQPLQLNDEKERMEASDSFVMVSSNVENSPLGEDNADVYDEVNMASNRAEI